MKVLTYVAPKTLKVEERPSRDIGAKQVKLKTMYTGVSHGTEMNIYRGIAPQWTKVQDGQARLFIEPEDGVPAWSYPVSSCDEGVWYMGYAGVGEVIEVGAEVSTLKLGDIVYFQAPHMSELIANEEECFKLPDGIDYRTGIFFNNLNTAFNAILDSRINIGDYVVVSGLGVLGQLTALLAKMRGAIVIGIDAYDLRLQTALKNGIDYVFKPGPDTTYKVKELTEFRGADLILEASGNTRGLQEAIRMAAYDGNVTCISWYHGPYYVLDFSGEFHHNRVTIRTTHVCGIDKSLSTTWDMRRRNLTCLGLLKKLPLSSLITTEVPFENAPEAYEQIDQRPQEVIQTIFRY